MTRGENRVYLQQAIARLKAEAAWLVAEDARQRLDHFPGLYEEIRACNAELSRNEQALAWLQNRIDTSL